MTDILIRDVRPEVLEQVDARAAKLGLSRSEYLRRQIEQGAARGTEKATLADLSKFSRLGDEQLMREAWS